MFAFELTAPFFFDVLGFMKRGSLKLLLSVGGGVVSTSGFAVGAIAMGPAAPVNVALNKPTFGDTAFGAPTSRGNDGIDGFDASGNWTHANYPSSAVPYPGEATNAPNAYWEVDLQGSFNLDSFSVTDRVGCCDPSRLDGSTVTLFGAGNSIVGTQTLAGAAGGGGFELFNNGGLGFAGVERVRIDGVTQYFQFSEFEAISSMATPINWALGASAQFYNSTGTAVSAWNTLPASNVTDGILGTLSHPLDQTAAGYYLEVDLGQEILVDSLDLTGRTDGCCPERLQDYTIEFVDGAGTVVHTMNQAGQTTTTENIDVISSFGGEGPLAQRIRIINSSGDSYGPQVGELQVYGITPIPEPSGAVLSMLGCLLLVRRRR